MKILLVTPMLPEAEGGGAIPVLLHAQIVGLRAENEVTLVTAIGDERGEAAAAAALGDSGIESIVVDRRQPRGFWRRWRRRRGLALTWALSRRPWRSVWFAAPGIQREVDRLLAERAFDLVVVEDSAMSSLRLPAHVPSVLTEHEVLRPRPIDWRLGRVSGWIPRILHELDWRRRPSFQREGWRHFDEVIVFTRRDAEAIEELAPEVAPKLRISPFGLILPPPSPLDREIPGTLLFVGNFKHQPNRDAALWLARDIVPRVVRAHPEVRLRIVGTSPTEEIRALGGPNVEVIADAPSVQPHIEAASIVMAPVRTGGGMRMKILQALAAGKAVVTTERGLEGFDTFAEAPPLAVAGDADQLAAATIALLDDAPRREALRREAREFAERHYGPTPWAERLAKIYREAIDARG